MAISRWLLLPNQNLSLVNKIDTPTFYQTLAGVTHLDEGEIVELEKRFWVLAAKNKDKSCHQCLQYRAKENHAEDNGAEPHDIERPYFPEPALFCSSVVLFKFCQ